MKLSLDDIMMLANLDATKVVDGSNVEETKKVLDSMIKSFIEGLYPLDPINSFYILQHCYLEEMIKIFKRLKSSPGGDNLIRFAIQELFKEGLHILRPDIEKSVLNYGINAMIFKIEFEL